MFNKLEWRKQYRKNNKDKINKQWMESYYLKHEYHKTRKRNLQTTVKTKFQIYKRRAKKKNLLFDLPFPEFESLVSSKCTYCDGEGGGIDRVNSSIGYIPDNCVSCCRVCNTMKLDLSYEDFIKHIEQILLNSKKIINSNFRIVS